MWPYMTSMGWWMMLSWIVGVGVFVLLVWLIANSARRIEARGDDSPEQILKRRYARGEIDREEFQRRLEDLRR